MAFLAGIIAAGELMLEPARRAFWRNLTGCGYRQEADIAAAVQYR